MKILNFFAKQATSYLHGGGQKGTAHLFDQLQLLGNERVLEIGVGTGASLVAIKSRWPQLKVSGVEVNPAMLQKAKSRLRFCGLGEVAVQSIAPEDSYPFPEAHFDCVYVESVLAIQPLERLQNMVQEIQRILKPGGRLAFNETLWLPNQDPSALQNFNQYCLEQFGIIQSNAALVDVDAWKTFFTNQGWSVQYCKKVEDWNGQQSFGWRQRLSQWYTYWARVQSQLDTQHRKEARELKDLERLLAQRSNAQLNAYIIVVRK